MGGYAGVPGVGVTPLINGVEVSTTNPMPVTPGGVAPAPWGTAVELFTTVSLTANGSTTVAGAAAGKSVWVTSYIFALTNPSDVFFQQDAGAQISVKGFGVLSGNEICGSGDQYLFQSIAGTGVNINVLAGLAVGTPGSVQVRYRQA